MKGFEAFRVGAAFWAACSAVVLAVRLCHIRVLWVDEAYGLAAARRILEGAGLYGGIWFDKPPLYAWIYVAWGAATGWPLRVAGTLFVLLCCWLAGRAAAVLFSSREGWYAAAGMAFFLSFDHAVAILSLAPDLLLIPFTLATVWMLAAHRPAWAAVCAALGLLANAKALALLPLLLFWSPRAWKRTVAVWGGAAALVCVAAGDWWTPVWRWGWLYSQAGLLAHPMAEGLRRTANWAGFHAALVVGSAVYFWRKDARRRMMAVWLALSLVQVAAGARFFPRYYLALVPVLVVVAARGFVSLPPRSRAVILAVTLLVPAARFGVRHWGVYREQPAAMRDLALWADCREAAARIRSLARSGDTLFVWGYRPELNVLAGLPGAAAFLDSQPLTGVLADRHLTVSAAAAPEIARRNRQQLIQTQPTFIADGLGPYNPALAISRYEDLRAWLSHYTLVASTTGTRIYRRRD